MFQVRLIACLLSFTFLLPLVPAQVPEDTVSTIHVYASLLQIPVLVTSRSGRLINGIAGKNFRVRLDDLPSFSPMSVRPEGDDPITLAVLIDNAERGTAMPNLAESLSALAAALRPADRVALYSMDGCKLRRHATLDVATAATLKAGADAALSFTPALPVDRHAAPCSQRVGLWDAAVWIAGSMTDEPGRRVLLILSNGSDHGSTLSPEAARRSIASQGTAAFGIAAQGQMAPGARMRSKFFAVDSPNALQWITQGSGGTLLETTPQKLPDTLRSFLTLVRGRYILEFHKPEGMTNTRHALTVTMGDRWAVVHAGGTTVVMRTPDDAAAGLPAAHQGNIVAPVK